MHLHATMIVQEFHETHHNYKHIERLVYIPDLYPIEDTWGMLDRVVPNVNQNHPLMKN